MGERVAECAFVPARIDPGALDPARAGQLVDVPMRLLVASHMAGETGAQAARSLGRAAVDVAPRFERRLAPAGLGAKGRVEAQQQRIGAGRRGCFVGCVDEEDHRPLT